MIHLHDGAAADDPISRARSDRARRADRARRVPQQRPVAWPNGAGGHHPATSDVEYAAAHLALFRRIERWKRETGRQFPTVREIMDLAEEVGWRRPTGEWVLNGGEEAQLSVAC